MMLKFFQNVTKNDNYLILESDSAVLKKLPFFKKMYTIIGKKYFKINGNRI